MPYFDELTAGSFFIMFLSGLKTGTGLTMHLLGSACHTYTIIGKHTQHGAGYEIIVTMNGFVCDRIVRATKDAALNALHELGYRPEMCTFLFLKPETPSV